MTNFGLLIFWVALFLVTYFILGTVYLTLRKKGHPVSPFFLKQTRNDAAEFAINLFNTLGVCAVGKWKAYAVPYSDSDVLQAISLLDEPLTQADFKILADSGVAGEWHVVVVNDEGYTVAKLGLSEFGKEFRVTSFETSMIGENIGVVRGEVGAPLLTNLPLALQEHWQLEDGIRAEQGKVSDIVVSTSVGVVRQTVQIDAAGALQVSRQLDIKPTPAIKKFTRKNGLFSVLTSVSVLMILSTCIVSLLQALLSNTSYELGFIHIMIALLVGIFSIAGGLVSKQDSIVDNSELDSRIRVFALISLFTYFTVALTFAGLTIISLLLSSNSWVKLIATEGLRDEGFWGNGNQVIRTILIGIFLAAAWASASVSYNATVARFSKTRLFPSQNRATLLCYTNYRSRAACDSLVTSVWEECFFRALLPVVLHDIIRAWFEGLSTAESLFLSILISSVLWALMHSTDFASEPMWRVSELAMVGLILGYMVVWQGLIVAMLAHFIYNFLVLVSHNDVASIVKFECKESIKYV